MRKGGKNKGNFTSFVLRGRIAQDPRKSSVLPSPEQERSQTETENSLSDLETSL